eukprot:comp24263_c11_seq5/m.45134 comp24263_c11_seq5/g.45134  ORF comp24263_c11_seq5/g.45134 comp24263_c11_seq5/m.45134 type:complete len:115 (-) comp24263_c11_seq5:799-1143(-)
MAFPEVDRTFLVFGSVFVCAVLILIVALVVNRHMKRRVEPKSAVVVHYYTSGFGSRSRDELVPGKKAGNDHVSIHVVPPLARVKTDGMDLVDFEAAKRNADEIYRLIRTTNENL